MISYLFNNGDEAPDAGSLSLGRFSVSNQSPQLLPPAMKYTDTLLINSGLVKLGVRLSKKYYRESDDPYYG